MVMSIGWFARTGADFMWRVGAAPCQVAFLSPSGSTQQTTGPGAGPVRFRRRGGLTEYVSGAGGRVLYGLRRDRRLAFGRTGVTGALRMELQPGAARLEFRSSSGRLLDRSRVSCSP